jgi:YD repeat-containing protein
MEKTVKAVLRFALVVLVVLGANVPARSQGTCSNPANPIKWAMSGDSGEIYEGPGQSASWRQSLSQNIAQYGGSPTCSYTFILDNPFNGFGHFYGECIVPADGCNAPPPDSCPECSTVGQPINLSNGNTFIVQRDLALPGLGGGLGLTRTWNSVWPAQYGTPTGLFGLGWLSNYEERVFVGSGDAVNFMAYARSDGSFWYFGTSDGTNWTLASPADRTATLVSGTSYWTLTFSDGQQRLFDNASGNLLSIADRNGNATQLTYDTSGRLTTATDPSSRQITFSYGSGTSRLVTSATTSVGPTLSYSYDTQGRLSQITNPDSSTISFTYDSQSMITSVTDSHGKVLESHTYDSNGRGLTSSRANGVGLVTITYPN